MYDNYKQQCTPHVVNVCGLRAVNNIQCHYLRGVVIEVGVVISVPKYLLHAGSLSIYFNKVHDYQQMFSQHLFRDKQST
jgi:hypothetical protein